MLSDIIDIVIYFLSFIILLYFPIALIQLSLIIKGWKKNRDRLFTKANLGANHNHGEMPPPILMAHQKVQGRKVIAIITTNGKNPTVVDNILSTLRSYDLDVGLYVIKEEKDAHTYAANEITVPKDFTCPSGSKHKLRALHYGGFWLKENGFGSETYVCHLDDDSVVSSEYLEYIFTMHENAGQGHIRLREAGVHLFSTLADMSRISDCAAFCTYFNSHGKPMAVHGEGLVIRADIEEEIGWDFGTYGADDIIMSQLIVKHGYSFGNIPHPIFIAPPVSTRDFYKQRRRWIVSMLWASNYIKKINPRMLYWLMYRYAVGWTGFFGFFLSIPGYFIHYRFPLFITVISVFNTICYFLFYQYGVSRTSRKYSLLMLILQFPVAIYEGGTLVYSVLFPPDKNVFDVIQKV